MAFYNCNGISSSGGNGGGISSLGKIEEYGYTLSEAKDILSFDMINNNSIYIFGITNQYIFYYLNNTKKIFKISYDDWSISEVTDIPMTVTDNSNTTRHIAYDKLYFCENGDLMLAYYGNTTYQIYRYINGEIIYTRCSVIDLQYITNRYAITRESNLGCVYNITGDDLGSLKCSFSAYSNPTVIDDTTFASIDNVRCIIFKLSNYNSVYDNLNVSIFGRSLSAYPYPCRGFAADQYAYYFMNTGLVRLNPRIKHVSFNPHILIFPNTKYIWMIGHILYDIRLDSTSKTYTIHKHADMVNKLTLYLKEGNEIFCDTNILHPITSNLIKSVNGYKCTSNGKCELWFREDPEELTYSII